MKKLLLLLTLLVTPLHAQKLDEVKTNLDQVEKSLERGYHNESILNEIKDQLTPHFDTLTGVSKEIEPKLEAAKERLTQLAPPKPEEGKPALVESDEVKKERAAQEKAVADLDAQVKQVKLQLVRLDQLFQKITDKKRQLFTAQVLERSYSVVQPSFWGEVSEALPPLATTLFNLTKDALKEISIIEGAFGLILIAIIIVGWRRVKLKMKQTKVWYYLKREETPFERAVASLTVALEFTLPPLLFTLLVIFILNFTGNIPPRFKPLAFTIEIAVGLICLMKGLSIAVLNPKFANLRLVSLSDSAALTLSNVMRGIATLAAITMVALTVLKISFSPLVLTIATTFIFIGATLFSAFTFLRQKGSLELGKFAILRPITLLFMLLLIICSITGYNSLAVYALTRLILVALVLCGLRLIFALISGFVNDFLSEKGKYGAELSTLIGISTRKLELVGIILESIIRISLLIFGVLLVLSPWGLQTSDFAARLDDSIFGFRLGDIRTTMTTIVGSVLLFIIGLLLTRGARYWLSEKILPRTELDVGLQNSLSTIFGYIGFVASLFGALHMGGVNLGSVTILAGALSVGIGFGLQSIVSNFVSGLILLAERPIRVGDSINVKGEEGRVRKISVRSTEIETFERSTVIIPNSELISGVVKNWTHANKEARITLPVRVAYDSDAEEVKAALLASVKGIKNVQKDPAPKVYLNKFLDNGLEFELRVIILNIDHMLSTKSELLFSILKNLNDKGIFVAPPEQRIQTKVVKNA